MLQLEAMLQPDIPISTIFTQSLRSLHARFTRRRYTIPIRLVEESQHDSQERLLL